MDQKNTIVKCYANPNCLFNHNGRCDNYVISIGEDGKCDCYVETANSEEDKTKEKLKGSDIILLNRNCGECQYFQDTGLLQCPCDKHEQYVYRKAPACGDFKAKRGQRAKSNFMEDSCNQCSSACEYYDFNGASLYCQLKQQYLGPEQLMKPCDLFKLFLPIADTKTSVTMKVAELNKPNKNKSTIREIVPECNLPVCDWSCKHALRSGPTFNPELWCDKMKGKPAVGLFCSDYEED